MEQAHARRDLPTYYRVNRAIHDRINAIAGNPILTHTFKTLNARLHALRFRSNLVQAKWDQAVAEHREMIEALAARDGERLRDLAGPAPARQAARGAGDDEGVTPP